jgi:Holliday junction DNA helicase RuvA
MIAWIQGVLIEAEAGRVVLGDGPEAGVAPGAGGTGGGTAGGVMLRYELLVPAYLVESLAQRLGERVSFHTIQYIETPSTGVGTPRLLGFATAEDKAFFQVFTTVKNVGPRKALRAMAQPAGVIAMHIVSKDAKALQKLPEIGKRLAETMVAELSGKVEKFAAAVAMEPSASADAPNVTPAVEAKPAAWPEPAAEALEALVRLGEHRAEAERRVARALERDEQLSTASADAVLAAALAVGS